MKTTEVAGKDPVNNPDRQKHSRTVASGSDPARQLLEIIAQQPLFKGLSEQCLSLLGSSAMFNEFEVGERILQQSHAANRFYLVLEGKVELEMEAVEQGMIHIQTLGPGDDLGWSWLFPPYYLHFSARAIEPTKAIFFYGTRLRQQCEEDHDFGFEIMKRITAVMLHNLDAIQQQLVRYEDTIEHLGGNTTMV